MSHLLDGAQCRGSPSSLYMIFEIRPIIKLIYRLALEGHGCPKIASILTEKGIYTPGYYKRIKGDIRFARFKNKGWTYVTVRKILGDVVYLGHIESNKYEVIIQTSL